jgi:DNA repair photolyase
MCYCLSGRGDFLEPESLTARVKSRILSESVKVSLCQNRPILQACSLEMFAHQCDPYLGCEHRCSYCYALNQAETDWSREIQVHRDFAARLRAELFPLNPQTIYFGMNTDPYQPVEEKRRHTRQALELLVEFGFSACLLTKSDLVLRDIDLLQNMTDCSVGFSLAFEDEENRRPFEPYAPSNQMRIAALKVLKEAGVETYVLICPVMPYITDVETLIDIVAPVADTIWVYALRMRSESDRNWQNLLNVLSDDFPELTEQYRQIAFMRDHPYWLELSGKLEEIRSKRGLNLRIELGNQG